MELNSNELIGSDDEVGVWFPEELGDAGRKSAGPPSLSSGAHAIKIRYYAIKTHTALKKKLAAILQCMEETENSKELKQKELG